MKGEFDSPSKAATDAYRSGWEKAFKGKTLTFAEPIPADVKPGDVVIVEGGKAYFPASDFYPNGCPILNEDLGTDQPNGTAA